MDPHYCDLCGCVCVACAQILDACDSCELKLPWEDEEVSE